MSDEQAIAEIRARQKQAATYWQNHVRKLRPQGLAMAAKIAATMDVPWLLDALAKATDELHVLHNSESLELVQLKAELDKAEATIDKLRRFRANVEGRPVDALGAAGQSTADWVDDATTPAAETQRRIDALRKAEVVTEPPATYGATVRRPPLDVVALDDYDEHEICGTDPENGLCAVHEDVLEAAWRGVVRYGDDENWDGTYCEEVRDHLVWAIGGIQHLLGSRLYEDSQHRLADSRAGQAGEEVDRG